MRRNNYYSIVIGIDIQDIQNSKLSTISWEGSKTFQLNVVHFLIFYVAEDVFIYF